jgi:hypothetical protein
MTANCDKENHEKVVFSFETGIVPVLFLTAAKCRHPHIRRAAVGLLSRHEERQENLWKAKVFARIAAHMIHIETETGKKFRQEQGQLSSLAVPRCSTPQEDLCCAPFKPTRPSTPDVGNFSLSPENSTNGYSIASTPDSCLSTQSNKDSVLTSIDDNCDGNFGIPEHLRISDAIIGPHEETGINVTLFRKPGPFCKEWEIWHDFIQVD